MGNHLTLYQSVITEIKNIISCGQEAAYSASSKAMLLTYWNIGKRIVKIIPKETCIITSNFISVFPMSRL